MSASLDADLDQIQKEQRAAWDEAQRRLKAGSLSESEQTYYEGIARAIESRKIQAHVRHAVAPLEARIRDLERHAASGNATVQLHPYKEEDSPVTKRSPVSQAAGAGSEYYNGRPRQ